MGQDRFQANVCAEKLKALADPIRLRMIDLLLDQEWTVGELATALEVDVTKASHHLQILKRLELVESRRAGKYQVYRLPPQGVCCEPGALPLLDLGCCRLEVPRSQGDAASGTVGECGSPK